MLNNRSGFIGFLVGIIVTAILTVVLAILAASAGYLTLPSLGEITGIKQEVINQLLSSGGRFTGQVRFLATTFFGETDNYFISPIGEAVFRSVTTDDLTVTRSETIAGFNADFLDSQDGSYYLDWNNFTNKPAILSSLDNVDNNEGNIDLIPSGNITITPNDSTNTITFAVPAISQGTGSGLNADLLDSLDSLQFLRSDTSDSFTSGTLTLTSPTTLAVQGSLSLPTGSITSSYITDGTITGADLASNITISTSGNIATTGSGTITSAGLLTGSSGLSLGGNLTFSPDNFFDIGASGATRPRTGYFGTKIVVGTNASTAGELNIPNGGALRSRNGANTDDPVLLSLSSANLISVGGAPWGYDVAMYGTLRIGTNPAANGIIRIPNNQVIGFRNAANTADILGGIYTNTSDEIVIRDDGGGNSVFAVGSSYISTGRQIGPVAASGNIRLPNAATIKQRNAGNTADDQIWPLQTATCAPPSNQSITVANTWVDACSITLSEGTWFITAAINISTTAQSSHRGRIFNSTDAVSVQESMNYGGSATSENETSPIVTLLTITATKTIKLQGTSDGTTGTILQNATNPGGLGTTRMVAIKVGN